MFSDPIKSGISALPNAIGVPIGSFLFVGSNGTASVADFGTVVAVKSRQSAQRARNLGAMKLLASWMSGDDSEAEQDRKTLAALKKALDEDRPSSRKLFP